MRLGRKLNRQCIAISEREQERRQRPEQKANGDADACEHQRLDQVDGKHQPARRAEALEGGDHLALFRHIAADGIADADAAE